jgi:chromate transporter
MTQTLLELFWGFLVISLLAFGGGGATIALVERTAVADHAWITPEQFAAAVSFGYITPGPILIMAVFVGYNAAGLVGAGVATLGVFVMPWALAAAAARQLRAYMRHPRLRAFGRGAAPAVIGLLVVTVVSLARSGLTNWGYLAIAIVAAALTARTRLQPIGVLAIGAALGVLMALPAAAGYIPELRLP